MVRLAQKTSLFQDGITEWLDQYVVEQLGGQTRSDYDESILLGIFLEGDAQLDIATFYQVVLPCRHGRCNASVLVFPPAEEPRIWRLASLLPFDCEVKTYSDRVTLFVMPWPKNMAKEMRGKK